MVRLKKSLGQHLLVSEGVLKNIARSLELGPGDRVIEIGGGTGNLTKVLLEYPVKELLVIELDSQMVAQLKTIGDSRLKVIQGDATKTELCSFGEEIKVVGNLPYNVASLIVERIVFCRECITSAVLMLQKEVALRLSGKGEKGWLSFFLQVFYHVEYLMSVPPRFFIPPPKVDSGVIRIRRKENAPDFNSEDLKAFLIKLFSHRRKMLHKKFDRDILASAGIEPHLRADQLPLEDILELYNVYRAKR